MIVFLFVAAVTSTPSIGPSVTASTAIATPAIQTVRIGNGAVVFNTGTTPPQAVNHYPPAYTAEARELGIEGTVTVQARFDIDGNFDVLGIVNSLGYGLDERALAALDGWTFRPAYRSGARVAVVANIDVSFSLEGFRQLQDRLHSVVEMVRHARALAEMRKNHLRALENAHRIDNLPQRLER